MQMFRVLYKAAGTNDASKAAPNSSYTFDIAALNKGAAKELCRDFLTPIYGKVVVVDVTPLIRIPAGV